MITEEMKKEILKLDAITSLEETMFTGEIAKLNGLGHITKDWEVFSLLGRIYKYGKIQGIRQERAKKKNKKALANSKLAKATIQSIYIIQ